MSTSKVETGRVLLVGGYGVVGTQTAELLRRHHPQLRLVIGGRTLTTAQALADRLGNADALVVDTRTPDPLANAGQLAAVAGLVHDPDDHLLRAAIRRGVAYIDITRGVTAQTRAYVAAALESPTAPVLFASNWMAGVPAVLAVNEARKFSHVDSINLSILFDRNDKTGPDSADAGGGLSESMTVRTGGAWKTVAPMSAAARVRFPSGRRRAVFRMNMADVTTLAQATGAKDVAVRIGLDSNIAAHAMRALLRTGLWNVLQALPSSKSPAHNPKAAGATHEIVVEIAGQRAGKPSTQRIDIVDPKGQAHLTAIGAVANLERLLGLTGAPLRTGVAVPETAGDAARLLHLLRAEGVDVRMTA